MNLIDAFLNRITMYRLLLYYLIALVGLGFVLAMTHTLPFHGIDFLLCTAFLVLACLAVNEIFARVFQVPPNVESVYITALILALIITPQFNLSHLMFLGWAAVWAMASKYILAYRHKHLFNPAAIAVAITAFGISQSATWWVGTSTMLPLVVVGGLLIVRKIRRDSMVIAFLIATLVMALGLGVMRGADLTLLLRHTLLDSPLFFFGFVMLTEPLTTPPTTALQIAYGALVGLLFPPQVHFGSIYSTPELALLVGNIFSFAVSPKYRLTLKLQEKRQLGGNQEDFVFIPDRRVSFSPGQYLEWTLPVEHPDDRGNRRYFTIASSPTEDRLHLGVKFYAPPSRFKTVLQNLQPGDTILASQLSGSFTLPKNPAEKCVFIAGGIGITPFRSMAKYIIDRQEQRDIVLFYSNNKSDEIVYTDVFAAAAPYGFRTIYTLTQPDAVPTDWQGYTGFVNAEMIAQNVPDYRERTFYLSGPHGMVTAFEKLLKEMGVPGHAVKTDYFPGFA